MLQIVIFLSSITNYNTKPPQSVTYNLHSTPFYIFVSYNRHFSLFQKSISYN